MSFLCGFSSLHLIPSSGFVEIFLNLIPSTSLSVHSKLLLKFNNFFFWFDNFRFMLSRIGDFSISLTCVKVFFHKKAYMFHRNQQPSITFGRRNREKKKCRKKLKRNEIKFCSNVCFWFSYKWKILKIENGGSKE